MQKCYTVACAPFEAACKIISLPESSPSSRLHGHGYLARIRADLPPDWGQYVGAQVHLLEQQLRQAVAKLDHRYLNDLIADPTNENIARWLIEQLAPLALDKVGIQSTHHEGVDIDAKGNAHSWKRFRFEAAHQLPFVEPGHQCGRMHGHGFEVILHAHQHIEQQPIGVDLDALDAQWQRLAPMLHLSCLNEISGLENPTSEHLCRWIWDEVKPKLEGLSWVSVYETASAGSHYDGADFRIWKEFSFESATALTAAPAHEPRAALHGHSYLARLHVQAPLDEVLGWTVDYGDVKKHFAPTLSLLDHQDLSQMDAVKSGDAAAIAQFIKHQVRNELPGLNRVDLYQTPGCGAVLSWADESPALPV